MGGGKRQKGGILSYKSLPCNELALYVICNIVVVQRIV
jgi:hypothetical protein